MHVPLIKPETPTKVQCSAAKSENSNLKMGSIVTFINRVKINDYFGAYMNKPRYLSMFLKVFSIEH